MRTISILLFLLNIIFIGKYLSTALTKWNLFNMRYAICVERLRREQKCGDAIVATYNSIMTIINIWVSAILFCCIETIQIPECALNFITFTMIGLLFLFSVLQYVLIKRNSLDVLYATIVDYRSKQKVVTADNDYEVDYIRTFKAIRKEMFYAMFWVVYMLCIHFYYHTVCL